MNARFLYMILAAVLLLSCSNSKNAAKLDSQDESLLNGTWLIEKTICCGRSQGVTYGGTKELTIRIKDSTYIIREQGKITERGDFKIDKKSQFGPVIILGNQIPAMYAVEDGKLWLNWGYMDLQEETYRKK
jgi:hypothetical protein